MEITMGVCNEAYFNRIYEDLLKEQLNILRQLKEGGNTDVKNLDKKMAKHLSLIADLMKRVILFRNFRKDLEAKL